MRDFSPSEFSKSVHRSEKDEEECREEEDLHATVIEALRIFLSHQFATSSC